MAPCESVKIGHAAGNDMEESFRWRQLRQSEVGDKFHRNRF